MPIFSIQQGERLMKKTRIIVMTILLAFLVSAQNATALTKAQTALSPYFQTDVDSTYSFIGVSHPSLTTAATQIGLTVATLGTTGSTDNASFTIQAGETYRIFIASTNHSTINNLTVTGSEVIFLATTSGSSEGAAVSFTSSKTEPALWVASGLEGGGSRALTQLTIWGAVVIPGTTSGFAMEFIGDAHGSFAAFVTADTQIATALATAVGGPQLNLLAGRGVN